MDPNSHSPASEIKEQMIESTSPTSDSDSIQREERTPTPPAKPEAPPAKPESPPASETPPAPAASTPENASDSSSDDHLRVEALRSELQEKEQLVTTLTAQLEQVVERLDHDQHSLHDAAVEHQRLQELETELHEKEQLVASLKERLSEVVEQLKQSQRENEELTAAENQRVKELEAELQEKEQLVVILTERLEQVAEQLDRRHRTGADRGMTISAGGIPQEVIEEQQKLSQDLQSVLEQWQGMDTESSLARIELQISELKKLVEDGLEKGPVAPKPASLVEYLASPDRETPIEEEPLSTEEEQTPEEPVTSPPAEDSTASGWEAMKEKLLSGQGVDVNTDLAKKQAPPPAPAPPQVTQPAVGNEETGPSGSNGRTLASYKPPLPDAPAEINYEQATQAELIEAVNERDQYISLLIKRVREAETALVPVNWEQLNNAPEELLEQLQTLHHDLEHNLGLAEVEISIERARLSRTESMLQGREEAIRKKEKQLGLNLERSEEEEVPDENQLNDDQKKRWLGFLN
ncbi:hypothetical protein Pan241w_43140 [Gimesia alba]|uniref:Uncharacterized protein n=1 Tax=Gimesia alba TaxID=2527973 RepID=A0A517RK00_9PLAN|nr:hypothetical protein [Gimesia alba]QDT44206.1 hypothetical protein Pan241w_43140 [Gimesia alba]